MRAQEPATSDASNYHWVACSVSQDMPTDFLVVNRRRYYFLTLCCLLAGCANVTVTNRREVKASPLATPKVIYITDFELDGGRLNNERGILPLSPIFRNESDGWSAVVPRLFGVPVDRGSRGRELTELMSSSLVEDLRNVGLAAYRLGAADKLPAEGWLVRGSFVRIDEGDRLYRAIIGFGSGETELELVTSLSDLDQGNLQQPFCELSTSARSNRQPGAMITFDPYVAAARFVVCGLDLDKNVIESAAKIATAITKTIHDRGCAG